MTLYNNHILQRLSPETLHRLELRPIVLPVNEQIEFPGDEIPHLIFLEDGIATMTATFQDGSQVEIGLAGWESVLGTSSMMGTRRSLNRVYMQIAGKGYTSPTAVATREFRRGEQFHDLSLRFIQAQFLQSAQTAGCNARHGLEARFARWLLLCADRVTTDVLPLRHEFIADMLGVSRSSVTITAGNLQDRGFIQYSRGKLKILDRAGLEGICCECYFVVRDHLNSFLEVDHNFGSDHSIRTIQKSTTSATPTKSFSRTAWD